MQDLSFRKKRKKRTQGRRKKKTQQKRGRNLKLDFGKVSGKRWGRLDHSRINAKSIWNVLLWIVEIVAVCLLAYVLVLFYGQRISNAGDSMSPAMKNGDVVLVDRLVYNARKPKRGEIIAFKANGDENAHYSIKRIAGLPGETVQIIDGNIYIDGEELEEHIFVSGITSAGIAEEPIELGDDEYFVIGDNHEGSDDSRLADVGNVKRDYIYGKVWFVATFGERFGFVKD